MKVVEGGMADFSPVVGCVVLANKIKIYYKSPLDALNLPILKELVMDKVIAILCLG